MENTTLNFDDHQSLCFPIPFCIDNNINRNDINDNNKKNIYVLEGYRILQVFNTVLQSIQKLNINQPTSFALKIKWLYTYPN